MIINFNFDFKEFAKMGNACFDFKDYDKDDLKNEKHIKRSSLEYVISDDKCFMATDAFIMINIPFIDFTDFEKYDKPMRIAFKNKAIHKYTLKQLSKFTKSKHYLGFDTETEKVSLYTKDNDEKVFELKMLEYDSNKNVIIDNNNNEIEVSNYKMIINNHFKSDGFPCIGFNVRHLTKLITCFYNVADLSGIRMEFGATALKPIKIYPYSTNKEFKGYGFLMPTMLHDLE